MVLTEHGKSHGLCTVDGPSDLANFRLAAASQRDIQALHRPLKAMLPQPSVVEKVRDIVGLYLDPPERALVLCVDESEGREAPNQIQALDRTQPLLPMLNATVGPRSAGQAERLTYDYKCHGTTSLFAALDIAIGKVIGRCFKQHRAKEFLKFLREIDANVPGDLDVHLVMDNYATHKSPF